MVISMEDLLKIISMEALLKTHMEAHQKMRVEMIGKSTRLNLGQLIEKLSAAMDTPDDFLVVDQGCVVTGIWRGIYSELAVGYEWELSDNSLTAGQFLDLLKAAIGAKFYGYKGGEFIMSETTPLWLANKGETNLEDEDGKWEKLPRGFVDVKMVPYQSIQAVMLITDTVEWD